MIEGDNVYVIHRGQCVSRMTTVFILTECSMCSARLSGDTNTGYFKIAASTKHDFGKFALANLHDVLPRAVYLGFGIRHFLATNTHSTLLNHAYGL